MTIPTSPAPLVPGARNATLEDLAALLRDQQARKVDIVAPAAAIRADGARLVVRETEPVLGPDGVTMTAGAYAPTDVCDQGIADKLGIPAAYLRKLREHKPGLYDANVNGWLAGDDRKFLIRCLRGDERRRGRPGVPVRRVQDHRQPRRAARRARRRPRLRVPGAHRRVRPDRAADVRPGRLRGSPRCWRRCCWPGYRSPFTGAAGADNPVVFSGFVITNSETGCGAFTLTPRLVVQVCDNGMTITRDAMRAVHLGERHEEGRGHLVGQHAGQDPRADHGEDHRRGRPRSWTRAMCERAVREMERDAGHPVADPQETIQAVSARLRFTDAQQHDILSHFIRGGDLTAGGVMHAVTSARPDPGRRRRRPRDGVAWRCGPSRRPPPPEHPARQLPATTGGGELLSSRPLEVPSCPMAP